MKTDIISVISFFSLDYDHNPLHKHYFFTESGDLMAMNVDNPLEFYTKFFIKNEFESTESMDMQKIEFDFLDHPFLLHGKFVETTSIRTVKQGKNHQKKPT